MKNKVFFIALNELQFELLHNLALVGNFFYIQKLCSFFKSETFTADSYDSDFLEPWVQWVSIQTGKPSSKHQIKHLGDIPQLNMPQIWEALSQQGFSSSVWGALNAQRGQANLCQIFIPDPWVKSAAAYPEKYRAIADFMAYACENRIQKSKIKFLFFALKYLKTIFSFACAWAFFKKLPLFAMTYLRHPKAAFVGFGFVEYLNAIFFLEQVKKNKTDFNFLFLNTFAHLQHYHWLSRKTEHSKSFLYAANLFNAILYRLFSLIKEDDLIYVANGLSQENTTHEHPWVSYRIKDFNSFLKSIDIYAKHTNPLMSYDAILTFNTPDECQKAAIKLSSGHIEGRKLFLVETYPNDPLRLFFRFVFTDPLPAQTTCQFGSRTTNFSDWFEALTVRTGKHIQQGHILSNDPTLPKWLLNHDLNKHLLSHFSTELKFQEPSTLDSQILL